MIGIWEILIILFVMLVMAGMVGGAIFLAVWLSRQGREPKSAPPRARGTAEPAQFGRFSVVEMADGRPRLRWGVYWLGLALVVIVTALLNGLLLAAGVWSGIDTVLVGLFVAVVVYNVFVIREFNKPGRTTPPNDSFSGNPPPGGTPSSDRPSPYSAVGQDRCPRCGASLPPDAPQGLCPRCVLEVGISTQTEASGECGPHGTKIVPPPQADVARRFPHLEILECLGHGGMGIVYKARQPKLDRLVALKILAPEKGADPRFAERFQREARALARLSHPHIVTVHDYGEADGMFYLLMEYVEGMTLRELLREGRMKPEGALTIVPAICEALQFAHEQGVVHRDIKPENVLLDKQGRVKIADFGIAKLVGPQASQGTLTEERSIIGTPNYMAPEQIEKPQLVDHRADIYSLGVVFYEMLTGELPLGKFQPPSRKVQVDVRLDEVVLHALEKEPSRRYQQASQVKTDVETIAASESKPQSATLTPAAVRSPGASSATPYNPWEPMIVFGGTLFHLVMLAILLELMRTSRVPFKELLLGLCLFGIGICGVSLAGLWPFASPFFPEPNFSSRNLRRNRPAPAPGAIREPHFSRTAIVGAAWAPFFVVAALSFFMLQSRVVVTAEVAAPPPSQAWWQMGLAIALLPLGLTAPFGTTILGGIAISQIRHSRGRLYGLGLAVFDVLLFPLLVVCGLITAGWIFAAHHLADPLVPIIGRTQLKAILPLLIAASCVAVIWFGIRWVWRAAHRPLPDPAGSAATEAAGTHASDEASPPPGPPLQP